MGFEINLLNNNSPVEKIGKDLVSGVTLSDVVLKRDTSILRPVLTLASDEDIYTYNYLHIPVFGRYYFIDDIRSVHDNLWEISAHVDVLETYKTDILNNEAILENTQAVNINNYLQDPDVFVTNCKHKTDIVQFPSGLLDTGEFILITAGG